MSTHRPSYRVVLRTPGIRSAFLASIIGRLSLATSGLALVFLLEDATASFTIAGIVTAALGLANVVATPWRSRLIDRFGQLRVLSTLGAAHAASLVALALMPTASLAALVAVGVVAGASSPPFGATMRVVWSAALPAGPARTRGFSLDAVSEEVTFAVGPLLAAALVALSSPLAALILSAVCVSVGSGLFVVSRLSRAQRGSHHADATEPAAVSPLRTRGFVPVICVVTAPGLILGAIELAAPALAIDAHAPALAGVLLAVFAGSSALGGLLFGTLRVPGSRATQLVTLVLALLVFASAAGLVGGVVAGIVGFALAGLCLAPILIVGYLAADDLTDARVRTEASSWINTAINFGAAVGAVVYGVLTDVAAPGSALTGTAIAAAVIAGVAVPFLWRSHRAAGRSPQAEAP